MPHKPPERLQVVTRFRERLAELYRRSDSSQAAFARSIGLDRSTLSQLLAARSDRLPRAENIVAIAQAAGVSIDWLLGLSEEGQFGTDVLAQLVEFEADAPSPADRRLARWHEEATGYVIRYVPTTLPDLLKTQPVIQYEYRASAAFTPEASIATTNDKLTYLHRDEARMEVCLSLQKLETFGRGEGIWRELDPDLRREQLRHMRGACEELYPALRLYLYDERNRYSVPLILFGPKRAAVYIGQMYLVFNGTQHIQVFTRHFDDLIRAAVVQPNEVFDHLTDLAERY